MFTRLKKNLSSFHRDEVCVCVRERVNRLVLKIVILINYNLALRRRKGLSGIHCFTIIFVDYMRSHNNFNATMWRLSGSSN
jgi:hypothetical protein